MAVCRGADGLAQFFRNAADAPVDLAELLLVRHHAFPDEESIVAVRLNFQVIVKTRQLLQPFVLRAVQNRPVDLPLLAGRAKDEPLSVLCHHAFGNARAVVEIFQVPQRNQLVEVDQPRLVFA